MGFILDEVCAQPFLRPSRAREARARDVVSATTNPHRAWRELAERGVIPAEWLDDARRRFILVEDDGLRIGSNNAAPPALAHPSTIRACITIASDPEGVLKAEAAARAYMTTLAPWGTGSSRVAVWDVVLSNELAPYSIGAPSELFVAGDLAYEALSQHDERATEDLERAVRAELKRSLCVADAPRARVRLDDAVVGGCFWQRACDLGLSLPAISSDPMDDSAAAVTPRPAEQRFSDVENPFLRAFDVWRTGYALVSTDDAMVLVALEA
ncbi:MAG: hypothetical protein KF819_25270 [Labilithrix sp.]|nr:hypothetical protein [Labilithrix sp.]